jgi:hypothetical protein
MVEWWWGGSGRTLRVKGGFLLNNVDLCCRQRKIYTRTSYAYLCFALQMYAKTNTITIRIIIKNSDLEKLISN